MTQIYERLLLRCPYVHARDFLGEALESAALIFEERMLVQYERGSDPLHFHEPWKVNWPEFTGELAVRANEMYQGAVLELQGEYAPPFGAADHAFDMITGTKNAAITARSLLERIASSMEDRYLDETTGTDAGVPGGDTVRAGNSYCRARARGGKARGGDLAD